MFFVFKKSKFLQRRSQIFVLSIFISFFLCFLFLSPALLAATQIKSTDNRVFGVNFLSQNKYQPYFELGGAKYFNQKSSVAGIYDLFIPLLQNDNQLLFTDLRIFDRSGNSSEGNLHLGYRKLYPDTRKVFGIYGAFDCKRSDKRNDFKQLTLGFEYWHNRWFMGGNVYKPIGETKKSIGEIQTRELRIAGRNITEIKTTNEYCEKALSGIDAEVGYAITESLTSYAGGYYFSSSDTDTITGPKIRLTYDYKKPTGRILGILDGISIEAGAQHDKPRGNTAYIGIKFKVGLTNFEKNSNISGFERHMVELVRRDPDVVVGRAKTEKVELSNKQGYMYISGSEIKGELTDDGAKKKSTDNDSERGTENNSNNTKGKDFSQWTTEELLKEFGLPKEVAFKEIRKRYHELVLKDHPDKGGRAEDFIRDSNIYEVLSQRLRSTKEKDTNQFQDPPSSSHAFSTQAYQSDTHSDINEQQKHDSEKFAIVAFLEDLRGNKENERSKAAVISTADITLSFKDGSSTISQSFLRESVIDKAPVVFLPEIADKTALPILYTGSNKSIEFKKYRQNVLSDSSLFFVVEQEGVNTPIFLRRDLMFCLGGSSGDSKIHSHSDHIECNVLKGIKGIEKNTFLGEQIKFSSILFLGDNFFNSTHYAIKAAEWLEERLKKDQRNYFGSEIRSIVPAFLPGWNYVKAGTSNLKPIVNWTMTIGGTEITSNTQKFNNINLSYEYEGQDIYDLLYLRAKEVNVDLTTAGLMSPLRLSNRQPQSYFAELLARYLDALLEKKPFVEKILIPLNLYNLHWVGLIAYLTEGQVKNIDYINSLRSAIPTEIEVVLKNIGKRMVGVRNLQGLIQKTDGADCGPLVVENLISAMGGNFESRDVKEKELKAIRYRHVELLENFRPEEQFYFRQTWGVHSFEYVTTNNTKLKGGLIVSFNQSLQPLLLELREQEEFDYFKIAMFGSGGEQTTIISTAEAVKRYFQIVIPFSLTGLITTTSNYINSIFLSRLDKEALAANGLIMTIQFIVCLGSDIPYAAGILISNAIGKEKYNDVGKIVRQSILLGGIVAIPQMAVSFLSRPMLSILGQSDNLSKVVQRYFVGYALGIPAKLGLGIGDQLVLGVSRPNLVLIRTTVYSVLTSFLGYGLIFGEFGMPKLDIAGLGYANSLASWLTLGGMMAYLWVTEGFGKYSLFRNEWRGSSHILSGLIRNGLPIATQTLFLTIGYSSLSIMKGWLGEASLLSQQIVSQTLFLFYCIESGISQAATTLVGRALGKGNVESARKLGGVGLFLGTTVAAFGEVLFITMPNLFASVFINTDDTENSSTMDLTKTLFFTEGLILISESLGQVSQAGLRGFMVNNIGVATNFVKVGTLLGLGYFFGFSLNWGLIGISCAEFIGSSAGAFISLISWFGK